MTISRTAWIPPMLLLSALAFVASAQAQPLYRIVGPDGKVTFSDRAPEVAVPGSRTSAVEQPKVGASTATLPYELRQVAQRFPVTLYSGDKCAACDSARSMLTTRGIPFVERTVNTNEDIEALQRLSGNANLPFATIGSQQLSGYLSTEWAQYLDAAGYPKQSQLPANYRRAAAAPLVALKPAQAAPKPDDKAAPATQRAPAPVPTGPTPSNPAGIRF
jgi:glutaredoxin